MNLRHDMALKLTVGLFVVLLKLTVGLFVALMTGVFLLTFLLSR